MKKELETLIQAVRIYNHDIEMEFGIEKCTMLIMKSRKQHTMQGIGLPNQDNQNARRKGNLQILENNGDEISEDERKN